jgi:hypothetical protein
MTLTEAPKKVSLDALLEDSLEDALSEDKARPCSAWNDRRPCERNAEYAARVCCQECGHRQVFLCRRDYQGLRKRGWTRCHCCRGGRLEFLYGCRL